MAKQETPVELLEHLLLHFDLDKQTGRRLVAEIVSFYDESVQDFVQRRHAELQREGVSNAEIFRRLPLEINERLFASATLSQRQIRRIIYG